MEGAAALTQLITYEDNIPANDADNADRRIRVLNWLQQECDRIHGDREWTYKSNSWSVAFTASTSSKAIGTGDFGDIPTWGGVFRTDSGRPLTYVTPQELLEERERVGVTREPYIYSLFGLEALTGYPLLQIVTTPIAITLKVWGNKAPPTILDDATTASNLGQIVPHRWHQSVVIPAVIARMRKNKADAQNWREEAEAGIRNMRAREQQMRGKATQSGLPGTFSYV